LLVLSETRSTARRSFALACIAAFLATTAAFADQSATPSPLPNTSSLKGKSDTELFQLITGQKEPVTQRSDYSWDDRAKPSPLDRLWEMPARDAAVAFVTDCPSKDASSIKFEIDDPNARPPAKGEIGIRWTDGNNYAPRQEGVTILRFDGNKSTLLMSHVEVVGNPSKQELERAIMETDFHEIQRLVAKQTYEILWWLRHVRNVGSFRGGVSNSNDDYGRFWMKPDGPVTDMAILGEPCDQWIDEESGSWQGAFAYALLRRLAERSGIKQRYPIPKVGRYVDNDPDSKFLRTAAPPDENDQEATKKWVGRLLAILQNPKRDFLHYSVIELLVPRYDPVRYNDQRINGALLEILQQSEKASAAIDVTKHMAEPQVDYSKFPNPKTLAKEEKARKERQKKRWLEASHLRWQKSDLDSNAKSAAAKLGLRDVVSAFPYVLRLSPQEAALILARHPELKPKFLEYLQPLISGESPGFAIDPIWRADLREFTPLLEKLANAELPAGENQEFSYKQDAQAVLMAWRETDALTKTKLDIMLTGKVGSGDPIPEVLRNEFGALSSEDKTAIRNFVIWMRTIRVPWMRKYIENVFTPHTPRPDNPMER
jgi:hypothetical protein